MLNFEEELKKFQPSLEVEDIEDAVYQEDLTDMTDILREMIEQTVKIKKLSQREVYGIYNKADVSVELLVQRWDEEGEYSGFVRSHHIAEKKFTI